MLTGTWAYNGCTGSIEIPATHTLQRTPSEMCQLILGLPPRFKQYDNHF
jgi:hypothetical protein